jgi:hypothetical protein
MSSPAPSSEWAKGATVLALFVIALAVARDDVVVTEGVHGHSGESQDPRCVRGPRSAMHDYGGVRPGPGVDVLTVLRRCPVTRAGPGDARNRLFRQLLSIAAGRRSR